MAKRHKQNAFIGHICAQSFEIHGHYLKHYRCVVASPTKRLRNRIMPPQTYTGSHFDGRTLND